MSKFNYKKRRKDGLVMDGNRQRGTVLHAAGRIRLMRNGNVVILISLAVVIFNAFLALVGALTNPLGFFLRGGTEMVSVFLLLGAVAVVVGGIMYLVGLYGLRNIRPEYQSACWWEIGLLILGIVINVVGSKTILGQTLNAARSILSLAVIWLVIKGTKYLMEGLRQEEILHQGEFVWRLTVVSTVLATIYVLIPIGSDAGPGLIALLVVGVILAVLSFVAAIYYVTYLSRVAKALEQVGSTLEEGPFV